MLIKLYSGRQKSVTLSVEVEIYFTSVDFALLRYEIRIRIRTSILDDSCYKRNEEKYVISWTTRLYYQFK